MPVSGDVYKQIGRNAAPDIGERGQLVAPQMSIEQHTVHEQRNRPPALLCVGNRAGRGFHIRLAGDAALLRHVIPPPEETHQARRSLLLPSI